ncbi:FAD binding domain-containing protein [Collybia nuda]|uniref:FAD binding domain-containing protein n=1 Tax=Collybia nuda TaxID=64659 RepID=A0A9P5YDQ8_9AGAR|nr:FAD binding domain-containing protein [Collybia nuda]
MTSAFSESQLTAPFSTSETDVLVIGAGPAGLMAAQALARLGIKVIVVERRSPGDTYGNADGLQPRTLEIWQSYGILDDIFHRAIAVHALVTYDKQGDGGIERGVPCQNIVVDCRYQYELAAGIHIIEGTLRSEFERNGGLIMQPAQPVKMFTEHLNGRDDCGVLVETQSRDAALKHTTQNTIPTQSPIVRKMEYIRAKYVIGADGAHSWVRQHLGVKLEGEKTEHVWGVVDFWAETNFPDFRLKCIIQSPQGAVIIIPREEDKLRIYVQFLQTNKLARASSATTAEEIKKKILNRIAESLFPYTITFIHIFWYTIFSGEERITTPARPRLKGHVVPQKVASSFRVGSTFIIGDACHTHSPKAAQGANVSMGDAHNLAVTLLAWKLAWVLRGWSSGSLLDTYEIERRELALRLIEFDKAISASLNGCEASAYSSMLHQQNLFSSGVGIQYQSSLGILTSQTPSLASLVVGTRLPPGKIHRVADWNIMDIQDLAPSDGLFKVLVFCGDVFDVKRSNMLREITEVVQSLEHEEKDFLERFTVHIIVRNSKEANIWDQIPFFLRNWKRVFTSTGADSEDIYHCYGISEKGAMVVIRPDGYISMILDVSERSAFSFCEFLRAL